MANGLYNNNPHLKAANVRINYSQEQLEEYIKCSEDVEYFIENYVKIVNVDRGLIGFDMYDYQRRMVRTFANNRFCITKMPRQSGKSTTVTSYILWKILFQDNQNCAILANKGQLARDLLEKLKLAYEHLPFWLQQGVFSWNKGSIELENGSKVIAASTSASAIRGGSYNLLMLDEFAFIPTNMAEEFFTSVYPTISSGQKTQVLIVSTPHGMNHYYKMWMEAVEKKSSYIPLEVYWYETPGRDEAWKEQTIRNTSQQQWDQEFGTEFIGSSDTLISGVKLRQLPQVKPRKDFMGYGIHEEPKKGHNYVVTFDTSHGKGLDYSAISVIDVTEVPYKLVAKYYDNNTPPMVLPEVVVYGARKYNDAWVLGEINDVGLMVVESIYRDLEYENVVSTINKGRAGQRASGGFAQGQSAFGVKTTNPVKRLGCASLKELIESDKLIVTDHDVVEEFYNFVKTPQSYAAEEGHHDDLAMSLVLFAWLCRQPYFVNLTSSDVRNAIVRERYAEVYDELGAMASMFDEVISEVEEAENDPLGMTPGAYWKNDVTF